MIEFKPYNLNTFIESDNNLLEKNKGKKHFPAAINEWKISSYNFNKSNQRNIASRNNMTDRLIKSYFYLSNLKARPRSRRMRSLYRKYTTKKIFVSRPTIKQTNDKVIVTLFTYNREKLFLLKKLYYYDRRLTYLDLWRKNKVIDTSMNFITINKKKPINIIANNIIKQNENIHSQFVSKLIDNKYKIKLYKKITNKISKEFMHNYNILANKEKKDIYSNNRRTAYKKNETIITTKKFLRKKMKRFQFKPSEKKDNLGSRKFLPNWGIKLKNEMNFLSFRILLANKKLAYASKLFYFYFLKYILSIFSVKLIVYKTSSDTNKSLIRKTMYANEMLNIEKRSNRKTKGKRNKKSRFTSFTNENLVSLFNSPRTIKSKGNVLKLCFFKVKKDTGKINKILDKKTDKSTNKVFSFFEPMIINVRNENGIENLDSTLSNINFIVSQFLDKILTISKLENKERKLYILYDMYYKKYYNKYIDQLVKRQDLLSMYYARFMINKFKFSSWLPNLKLAIGKIYNKKVELNIINLKYPHLNTDIYSKLISLKLRKRLSLLKVLEKGLDLSKRPYIFKDKSQIKVDYDLNKLSNLYRYKSLKIKNTNLTELLNKIYPRSMINNANSIGKSINHVLKLKVIKSKVKNVLMLIKYKTMSGVRIEAAGRVTRRYTASRSVHKVKYKGNLRNMDYSRVVELKNKSQSAVMLRNQAKANIQYSATQSRRRVGSFGVKGWISAY